MFSLKYFIIYELRLSKFRARTSKGKMLFRFYHLTHFFKHSWHLRNVCEDDAKTVVSFLWKRKPKNKAMVKVLFPPRQLGNRWIRKPIRVTRCRRFQVVVSTLSLPSCRVNPKGGDCVVRLSLRAVLVLEGALSQYFIFWYCHSTPPPPSSKLSLPRCRVRVVASNFSWFWPFWS